jgi:hypothetical protein
VSERKFRTIMRVQGTLDTPDGVFLQLVVAGWNPHRTVLLPADAFPDGVLEEVEHSPGPSEASNHIFCHVNLGAERGTDLDPEGPFELVKGYVIEDEDEPLGARFEVQARFEWDKEGKYVE